MPTRLRAQSAREIRQAVDSRPTAARTLDRDLRRQTRVRFVAQAAHARFVYVAQEAPSPGAQAIIVKQNSALRTFADLKGKRIAVTKAAGSHYLLLAALAKAGLTPADVRISYLTPADGRAAFERDSVDAWITWDPYVASVDRNADVRILADGNGLASYQRYYLASATYAAAHPEVIRIVYDQLTQAGDWLRAHPQEAATLLAPVWVSTRRRSSARTRGAVTRCAQWPRRTSASSRKSPTRSSRRDCCPRASKRTRRSAGTSRRSVPSWLAADSRRAPASPS